MKEKDCGHFWNYYIDNDGKMFLRCNICAEIREGLTEDEMEKLVDEN